jgi:murein DD-endopeptidase MepM/ murein hydrolase activator NlpD
LGFLLFFGLVGFLFTVAVGAAFIFRGKVIRKYYAILSAEEKLAALQRKYMILERRLRRIDSALVIGLSGDTLPVGENTGTIVPLPIFVQECDTPCAYPVSAPIVRGMHGDYHVGVDLAVPEGTPVFATAKGVVERVGRDRRLGLYVRIRHERGYETVYAHLDSVVVKEGDSVRTADMLGFAGRTGLTTGPHVHYEVYKDGKPLDPAKLVE